MVTAFQPIGDSGFEMRRAGASEILEQSHCQQKGVFGIMH